MTELILTEEHITLQNALKSENLVGSGGEAKLVISDGLVKVNGEIETRRGKKLRKGDIAEYNGEKVKIV